MILYRTRKAGGNVRRKVRQGKAGRSRFRSCAARSCAQTRAASGAHLRMTRPRVCHATPARRKKRGARRFGSVLNHHLPPAIFYNKEKGLALFSTISKIGGGSGWHRGCVALGCLVQFERGRKIKVARKIFLNPSPIVITFFLTKGF